MSWKKGDWKAYCMVCGRRCYASQLLRRWDGLYVEKSCWESRHPQDFVRAVKDNDKLPFYSPPPGEGDVSPVYTFPPGSNNPGFGGPWESKPPTGGPTGGLDNCSLPMRSSTPGLGYAGCMMPTSLPHGGGGNTVSVSWPSEPLASTTTVYGSQILSIPPTPPPLGTLSTQNTTSTDSAYTYYNAIPANVKDSTQIVGPYGIAADFNGTILEGVYVRANLSPTPPVLITGYRFDYQYNGNLTIATLRWIKFTAGIPSVVSTVDFWANAGLNYYKTNGALNVKFNVTITGSTMRGFLSAAGQPDTPICTYTDPLNSYTTGYIGFLWFSNSGGVTLPGNWSTYSATWTT